MVKFKYLVCMALTLQLDARRVSQRYELSFGTIEINWKRYFILNSKLKSLSNLTKPAKTSRSIAFCFVFMNLLFAEPQSPH